MRYEIIDNDSGEVIRRCHDKPTVPTGCRVRALPKVRQPRQPSAEAMRYGRARKIVDRLGLTEFPF